VEILFAHIATSIFRFIESSFRKPHLVLAMTLSHNVIAAYNDCVNALD
jgi:hypothetical protein